MAFYDKKFLTASAVSAAVFLALISTTAAQGISNYYAEKPGSCPPPLPVQICSTGCYVDGQCQGIQKCCPTSCGGTVCSIPVTMRRPAPIVKAGYCPTIPTGRWVCTPTCSTDGDCSGIRKCCKNRCGAMACQKPQQNIDEEENYMDEPARNPFLVYVN